MTPGTEPPPGWRAVVVPMRTHRRWWEKALGRPKRYVDRVFFEPIEENEDADPAADVVHLDPIDLREDADRDAPT